MGWLNKLFKSEEKSGSVAKTRLQMVLTHDRSSISPGLIDEIKDDIIEVIAKRLDIDRDHVVVNLSTNRQESRLVAEIPTSPSSSVPMPSPMHGPQPGGSEMAPASRRACQSPRFSLSRCTSLEAAAR